MLRNSMHDGRAAMAYVAGVEYTLESIGRIALHEKDASEVQTDTNKKSQQIVELRVSICRRTTLMRIH